MYSVENILRVRILSLASNGYNTIHTPVLGSGSSYSSQSATQPERDLLAVVSFPSENEQSLPFSYRLLGTIA